MTELPKGSFVQFSKGLNVSSPELCYVQMARQLSLVELISLGYELCGTYRIENDREDKRGFKDDVALTSVAKLIAYCDSASGLKGKNRARQALRYVAEGSASPMETILTILLTLPYRFGGYGFSMPCLNYPIYLSQKDRKVVQNPNYYCDLYWPKKKIDIEYDSDSYHAAAEKLTKDADRRTDLSSMGITVITVTRAQVTNILKLRRLAKLLGKVMKKELKNKSPDFAARQVMLHGELFSKVGFK